MPDFPLRRRAFLLGGSAAAAFGPSVLRASADTRPDRAGRNHALLVAVTQYPHLFRSEWLEGPNNDAGMMHRYLTVDAPVPFAPEDVRVLASGLDMAQGEPELAAIRAEMARLAEQAEAGDFVLLHFGGHGIEQPARFPDQEVDGRDQVFMPKDVRRMTRALGHWPNGYVDKDIKEDITAIRRKGAFVWAIFDCCHSGTITRALDAVPAGEVSRKIDLRRYDIPPDLWSPMRSRALDAPDLRPHNIFGPAGDVGLESDLGPLVAFFAAQTTEETPELPLPPFADGALQMGLFSFTLLTKLRENPQMSYRQLGQAIHHAYLGMNRARPSPLFEGALNAPLFNRAGGAALVPQWRITGQGNARAIDAGQMHLLAPGTRLAVLSDPAQGLDQALGVVEIARATALRSELRALEDESDPDLPAIALGDIPANAYARLIESVVDFELRVALPDPAAGHEALAEMVAEMMTRIAQDDRLPLRLQLVGADQQADLRLVIRSEADVLALMQAQSRAEEGVSASDTPRLWLLDTSATLSLRPAERPFSRPLDEGDTAPVDIWLRNSLATVYRATNLARLAQFDDFGASDVQLTLTRLPEYQSPLASGEEIVLHRNSIVRPGNTAHVRVENSGSAPVDVNILYIASNYAITSMLEAPVRLRAAEPGAPNAVFSEEIVEFDDTSFGRERLMVIVTAAEPQANPLDLSFLEQMGVRALGQAPASGFGAMIQSMASGAATRGGASLAARRAAQAGQRGAVYVFSVDNLPVSG